MLQALRFLSRTVDKPELAQNLKEFWASFLQKKIREAMKPLAVGV